MTTTNIDKLIAPDVRLAVEAKTDELFERVSSGGVAFRSKQCCHWALSAALAIEEVTGLDSCVNAGTAEFWATDHDDMSRPTHFSYHWQGHSLSYIAKTYLSLGILPEIHAWAVIPSLGVICDPTTRFLKELTADAGIPWTQPDPPHCFWGTVQPHGWTYEPHRDACELVYRLFGKAIRIASNASQQP